VDLSQEKDFQTNLLSGGNYPSLVSEDSFSFQLSSSRNWRYTV